VSIVYVELDVHQDGDDVATAEITVEMGWRAGAPLAGQAVDVA